MISGEIPRSILAAFFSNELWFVSMTPNLNVPLWSIGFEFWYYTLFAIFIFAPRKVRWLGIGAVLLIMGPQMWLLAPCWVMGAAIYRLRDRLQFSRVVAVAIFVLAPIAILVGHGLHAAKFLQDLYLPVLGADFVFDEIFFARDFIWQNVIGALVAAHLAGAMVLFRKAVIVEWVKKPIQAVAGVTYSVYLLHFPAMLMIGSLLHAWEMETMKVAVMFAGSLAISAGFGYFLEPLKFPLRDLFRRILWAFTKKRAQKMAPAI
jgi:peptidoglycan/LPS O-acetylase OafA/YrhL